MRWSKESTFHGVNPGRLSREGDDGYGCHLVSPQVLPKSSPLRPCGLTDGEQSLLPEIVNLHNLTIVATLSEALVTTTRVRLESLQWQRQSGKTKQNPQEVLIFFSHVRMALQTQL